ncbi:MAG TPA: helicase-related protein [Candidatus Paceibacterota bacterium]
MENPFKEILPIDALRSTIEQAVQSHRVVVIQTKTGSGKSTRVPQYLLQFADRVVVTQPRRIAAATIAKRVAEEMDVELGTTVGYRTGTGSKATDNTRLLYCTDGLEVLRQLFDGETRENAIVVIDEAHEWSLNLELLIAWFKYRMDQGLNIRLVILSATIEAKLLTSYFDDVEVISAAGHTFSITDISSKGGVVESARMLLDQECNVLVFMPGKVEIRRVVARLRKERPRAIVLPLYADLSLEEQEACFASYDFPKCVVATNVAQTSITIPDIDAVVDSGIERRPEMVDCVEGLYVRPISLADREQRRGRGGRVRPGVYVDCCPTPIAERRMFSLPAIRTQGLEGLVLQLAYAGLAPEDLVFFHRPEPDRIDSARRTLQKLRCLDASNQVTEIGRRVASIPLSVRYARMVVETYEEEGGHNYVDTDTLMLAVILEEGGVLTGKSDAWKERAPVFPPGGDSDAYAELAAFRAARSMSDVVRERFGIDDLACERVLDSYRRVRRGLRNRGLHLHRAQSNVLQRAVAAGLADQVYQRSLVGKAYKRVGSTSTPRHLPSTSVVKDATLIVGMPWSFQVMTGLGPQTKRFIRAATEVTPELLRRVSG